MLQIINLIPAMPSCWQEGHPAPWRAFPGYQWSDKAKSVPGQDLPWEGPGSVESICDQICNKTNGAYRLVTAASNLSEETLADDVIVIYVLGTMCRPAIMARCEEQGAEVEEA